MGRASTVLAWSALAAVICVPLVMAATSPLLAWREPVYVAAGLAGVVAMGLLLLQPVLALALLPGLSPRGGRRLHGWVGAGLVFAVAVHVAGLWITSPPDVVDALLFRSPTPFSAWGVAAMVSALAAGLLAAGRRRLRLTPTTWRLGHLSLAAVAVVGSVVHAMLVDGTMEVLSKAALCLAVLAAAAWALTDRLRGTPSLRRRH